MHVVLLGTACAEDLAVLSRDEVARASAFTNGAARERFVAGRAALRRTLATYLSRDAVDLRIAVGEQGKPRVEGLPFSVSHSGDVLLIAVAADGEIGVDVERHRSRPVEALARRFFSEAEIALLGRACEADRIALFHTLWTRKEAWLKGHGQGLVFPLSDWDVSGVDAEHSVLRDGWRVYDLAIAPGFSAALAASFSVGDITLIRSGEVSGLR
ncbi:hypothetical protein BH09SUM1_BH09SUM1_18710 [soil metagenome]